ncbi:MAG: hypothetical protein HY649_11760 [Acidobacteria bacterium]|nr:hypothetical protein [Acidobacteriota bacterium]
MKRILIPTCVLVIATFVVLAAHAQQPSIASDGIRNGASYALSGLPNAGIAQGSIFIVFGQNMGPASLVQVSSFPLPTSQGLAGTSVKVTVGGTTVDAIMLYTLAGQVAAVLPSNTPLGSGTVTVTYNNQTSNSAPVTVVRNSFGTFTLNQAGSGPGVIQNYNSAADAPFNTVTEAARPGQVVILWGTGLGPVSGNEAGQALPGDMANVNARVLVGGREAAVQYRGRSGCCVGIDQVNFVVPQGVEGCYVPVAIQIGNVVSNYASMAISSSGKVCSDPGGFTTSELDAARASGSFRLGSVSLSRTILKFSEPGLPAMEFKTDSGGASFYSFAFNRFVQSQGLSGLSTIGSCVVSTFRSGGSAADPVTGTGLEAGPAISISGPLGSKQLPRTAAGIYSAALSDPFGGTAYLEPGSYSVNNGGGGSGANAVGSFQVTHTIPATLQWTNEASISTVNRAQGVQVTWSGGDPNSNVQIIGSSSSSQGAGATFICVERTSAGNFTVPAAVLLALPPSATGPSGAGGILMVGSSTNPARFSATGLDAGFLSSTVLTGKTVTYQ